MDTSKLKPFDIQKALAGESVCLVTGEIITPKDGTGKYSISIRLGDGLPALFYEPYPNVAGQSAWYHVNQLFMTPRPREVWVNLYSASAFVHGEFYGYESEEQADRADVSGGKRLGSCAHKIIVNE